MTSIVEDPLLGPKMLDLLSKELKKARIRIEQLESVNNEISENARNERAEAENALETLRDSRDDATTENRLLRASLEDAKEQKKRVKMEKESNVESRKIDRMVSTDEVEAEQNADISRLERRVQKYREKYKAEQAEKKELAETLKNLEAELSDVRAANKECFKFPALTPLGDTISWDDVINFVMNLKPLEAPSGRFPEKDLKPVCHISVDLTSYLLGDALTSKHSKEFLYLPDLLIWCPDQINAIALGPLYTYDQNAMGQWRKKSIFEPLYNKAFTLFKQSKEYVFYVGTYKAIPLLDQLKDGISVVQETGDRISQRCLSSLVKSTYDSTSYAGGNDGHNKHNNQLTLKEIHRLYLDGTLNVEPLGLQYIGFNDALYKNLIKRFQGARSRIVIPEATVISVAPAPAPALTPKESNAKRKAGKIIAPQGLDNKKRRISQGVSITEGYEKEEKQQNRDHAQPCSAGAISTGAGKKTSKKK